MQPDAKAPALIGTLRQCHRRSCAERSLAPATSAHLQPLFAESRRSFLWFMMMPSCVSRRWSAVTG